MPCCTVCGREVVPENFGKAVKGQMWLWHCAWCQEHDTLKSGTVHSPKWKHTGVMRGCVKCGDLWRPTREIAGVSYCDLHAPAMVSQQGALL
jgi:hypothetical protein